VYAIVFEKEELCRKPEDFLKKDDTEKIRETPKISDFINT
jgi:hypothetical protein